jgi:histidinol-phosphate aminotransferase
MMAQEAPSLSRRGFAQMLGAGAALAALRPAALLDARTLNTAARAAIPTTARVVRLSSNENPYGPSPAALRAMTDAFGLAWRYPDEHQDMLVAEIARLNTVPEDQILLGNGSGEILKVAAAAFTDAGRKMVVAEPTFEAIAAHARASRAEVVRVPLAPDFRHDLPKMLAVPNAGLIYVCNPNNPTASITPKGDVRALLAKVSRETVVLVDEAYYHYAETNDYESVIPLVKEFPNLIVARTFSKIYGMAGLRCGYCVAQSALVERMRAQQAWDSVNIMALAAALASLRDPAQVTEGRRRNTEVKQHVYSELDAMGLSYIPSAANFLMIELRREVKPLIAAMRARGVEVGRLFPALPTHMRVTVGTRPEMELFLSTLKQVLPAAARAS